jgi:hypothetical protein
MLASSSMGTEVLGIVVLTLWRLQDRSLALKGWDILIEVFSTFMTSNLDLHDRSDLDLHDRKDLDFHGRNDLDFHDRMTWTLMTEVTRTLTAELTWTFMTDVT